MSRIQVLVPDRMRAELEELAQETGRSLSDLGREALERLLTEHRQRKRQAALQRLLAIQGPVEDWAALKRELLEAQSCDIS